MNDRRTDYAAVLYAMDGWRRNGGIPPKLDIARETFDNVHVNSPLTANIWLERADILLKLLQQADNERNVDEAVCNTCSTPVPADYQHQRGWSTHGASPRPIWTCPKCYAAGHGPPREGKTKE